MATPPESPIEEVVYELETSRVPKPVPVALEDLCRLTKFTRQEIRVMYRGFKTVSMALLMDIWVEVLCVAHNRGRGRLIIRLKSVHL